MTQERFHLGIAFSPGRRHSSFCLPGASPPPPPIPPLQRSPPGGRFSRPKMTTVAVSPAPIGLDRTASVPVSLPPSSSTPSPPPQIDGSPAREDEGTHPFCVLPPDDRFPDARARRLTLVFRLAGPLVMLTVAGSGWPLPLLVNEALTPPPFLPGTCISA